ncbi:SIR2 family protein [Acinetobacter baumannii]|uniref:SIR2 family protein n=1 Tax=Acinetobacter baumannii TaxID=470 RepID=UPI0006682A0B|nr:SIR2 family protein [Acinetobacter baumannii]MCL6176533.1 SIR2 family protein [Acinetobacter baumannii]MCL6178529.1 SIR2 family protein [Acinetobacter baumannii]MCL6185438.1 SIR2 family protein [Acinetobacter baumannii]MCL6207435.1 SIR2 family protein [Acinetobacter baumannii]MCL6210003.1 SIR2 family protein [Acinetobacter baumannii]
MEYTEKQILEGKAVLFLGAGASYNCTNQKKERIGFTGGELLQKINEEFLGNIPDQLTLDFASTSAIQISGREAFDQFIKDLVCDFEPTIEHKLITEFKWKAIFTTNYDEAIETAFKENKATLQKIEKIISDNDSLQRVIVNPDKLPLIKIHGCISRPNDSRVPLVIASSDYRRHLENRSSLYQYLKECLTSNIVIFYGYGLADSNIIGILDDLEKEGVSRARHIWLDPFMKDVHKSYWQSKNLECKVDNLYNYLKSIQNLEPNGLLSLNNFLKNDSVISKIIPSNNRPGNELEKYLSSQLIYMEMTDDIKAESDRYNIEVFYRGNSHGFGWLNKKLDFQRSIERTLEIELFENFEISNHFFNFLVINGYAGSGKSVLLKRLAWNGVSKFNNFCFYLKEGASLNTKLIFELIELIKEPIIIFVDDILDHQEEIIEIKNFSIKACIKIFIVGASRSNEWNNSDNKLDKLNPSFFSLKDLNDIEIKNLIDKLKEFKAEGNLKELNDQDKYKFIKEKSNNQLLVTLLEATHYGQEFSEIIKDEYEGIYDRSAKDLYLSICCLHRHGIELRAGMIKRLSGIDFEQFKEKFLQPLELLVVSYHSYRLNDIVYTSRHSHIAEHVFKQAFMSELDKAQQIIKLIRYLNIGFDTDAKALDCILKGRVLAEEFSNKELAHSIFNVAQDIGVNNAFILHQRAILEINHANPNYELALDFLKRIDNSDIYYDMRTVEHTKANAYRKLALNVSSRHEKIKYRNLSLKLLNENIRTSVKSSMPYHTKGLVLLDEIKDCDNENDLVDIIKDFENNLSLGFRKFPYDESLILLEHDFSKEMNNSPRAIEKIKEALRKNSDNVYIVQRYAKFYIGKKDYPEARTCMLNFLRNDVNNRAINYLMAYSYIDENEKLYNNQAISYLKKCYSSNDTNYEPKFLHARLEYIYQSEEKALKLFKDLSQSNVRPKIKNRISLPITDIDGNEVFFEGQIVTVNDQFGFVKTTKYTENIYIHKSAMSDQEEWEALRPNDPIKISICFSFRGPRAKIAII